MKRQMLYLVGLLIILSNNIAINIVQINNKLMGIIIMTCFILNIQLKRKIFSM